MNRFPFSFPALALFFAFLCAPLIFSSRTNNYSNDERSWHIPAVRQIREHWPKLDLQRDSLSATAPGYHYFLATVSHLTGTSRLALRLVTWAVSLALLFLLWRLFPISANQWAAAAILPLACSNFFVKSASWVVTDNPGLLCAAATLAAVFFVRGQRGTWVAGLAAGGATFVRQLHVWTAVPIALAALREWAATGRSVRRLWLLWPIAIPFGVVAPLLLSWHGLVPPVWQTLTYQPGDDFGATASVCCILALFFLLGMPYRCALGVKGFAIGRWEIAGAISGLVLALSGPTDLNPAAGRWSGYLWSLIGKLPVFAHRSILFIVFAPLGGALLADMARRLAREAGTITAAIWLLSYLAWAATFLPNRFVYQRYFEPMTLVFLIVWLAAMPQCSVNGPLARRGWLLTLTAVQLLITLATAHYQTYMSGVASAP